MTAIGVALLVIGLALFRTGKLSAVETAWVLFTGFALTFTGGFLWLWFNLP